MIGIQGDWNGNEWIMILHSAFSTCKNTGDVCHLSEAMVLGHSLPDAFAAWPWACSSFPTT